MSVAVDQALVTKWAEWLLVAVNVLAVIALAQTLVHVGYTVTGAGVATSAPQLFGVAANPGGKANKAGVDASAIALWNLFGKEGESKGVANKDIDAPKTQLQLELQGVFVAEREDDSSAIIAERGQEAKLFHVGEKLPGNASLAGVMTDHVLLNTLGHLEALYFPDAEGNVQGFSLSGGGAGAGDKPARQAAMSSPSGMPPAAEMAKALREEIAGDPVQTLKEMGLEMNGGHGYKISDSSNPMFAALGAKPGDTIISINGRSLGNIEADLSSMESLMGEGTLKVELERNGTRFSTEVPLP